MTKIRAFKSLRPAPGLESTIASRPYDVLSSDEARAEREGNDKSFYRIIKPEVDLATDIEPHSEQAYEQAATNLNEFVEKAWMVEDEEPKLYFYRQRMDDIDQTGLVCVSHIDDYFEDNIKKHEFTRPQKEEDRIAHMSRIGAHPGPVFLSHPHHSGLKDIRDTWKSSHQPTFSFTADDGVLHEGWVVDDEETIAKIQELFESDIPKTYIADGHHRSAASAKVGQRIREENPESDKNAPHNFFLSVIFDENDLSVWDYNRVVKDLNGNTTEELIQKLSVAFEVTKSDSQVKPSLSYHYGMYLDGQWYELKLRNPPGDEDPVASLDVSVLSAEVLSKLLGIEDQRTSDRIDFIGGIRGMSELEKRVDSKSWKLAFSIHPVTMQQLMAVAEAGEVMPPKSTWFEPKLRSGLFVHRFRT